jgi:hypothetical protein
MLMAEAKSQIAFDELGLGSVLKQYRLQVPPNQRDYSWEDREVKQLLQDFATAIDDDGPYFLGTVVTIPYPDGPLEVVDGQQRLATTAILLAAIRDYLREQDEEVLVESINNEFLTGIDRKGRSRVAKLRLNLDDAEFFNEIIERNQLPEPGRESHELLAGARAEAGRYVKKIVSPYDAKDHGDILNRWVTFIEERALVVLLRVPNSVNAYKMFETLNDRGLRTSQADLIKNYLFGRAGDRLAEVQNRWSYMRGALEASEEEDITINFLRHALIVLRGPLREADVYEEVQKIAKSEQGTVQFASLLESLANTYVATFNPEHERWNGHPLPVRRAIEVLNLFKIRPLRPLILAIAAKMDERETAKAFQFLVSLGVRLMIASSTRSGSVEVPLADAAKDVFAEQITTTDDLISSLGELMPSDGQFKAAFETARVSNARLARYYLRSLELAVKKEPEPWFIPQEDGNVINLEHVLPKKPEGNWPGFTDDDHKLRATRLGNQALMRASDNSDKKSDGFEDKKAVYAGSPYVLTSQIAELEKWDPEAIDNRQAKLAGLAAEAWPIKP